MDLTFNLTNYYDHSWDIKFQGKLNDAHWYVYDITHDEIILCHDTDPDIITFCKVLGDSIDVWIDGDRTECPLDVNKHFEEDAVFVTLHLDAHEEALYNGPYDSDTHAEVL
jgi:hypothetical protein